MNPQPSAAAPDGAPPLESLRVEPLLTSAFDTDPAGVYAHLRRTYGPVAPVGLMGVPVWLVLDYREVLEVLRKESLWRRDIRYWRARAEGRLPQDWPLLAGYEVRQTMFMDDEEHLAARQTYHSALGPFQDARTPQGWELRSAVVSYADELVAMLAAESGTAGFMDLAAQYTRPLLLMVTTRLFGCPVELGDELVIDMWRMLDGGADAGPATGRALAAMTRLAAHRRAVPGDDLTSYMLLADPSLSDEQLGRELFMNAVYLNDITGNMVCNTLLEVLRGNATVRRSLSAGLIGETVNRAALANAPVANMCFRFAAHDVRLGNFWIRAGDVVSPSAAAAHQDLMAIGSHLVDSTVSTRAHLGWGPGRTSARALPASWRVRWSPRRSAESSTTSRRWNLRCLPISCLGGRGRWCGGCGCCRSGTSLAPGIPSPGRQPAPRAAANGAPRADASQASRNHARGLLSALRNLMWGTRKGG